MDDSSHPLLDDANYHPILDDSSHPILDDVNYHPILDDSSHPLLDDVNYHPILDDSSHPLLDDVNYHPTLDLSDDATVNIILDVHAIWEPPKLGTSGGSGGSISLEIWDPRSATH